MTERNDKFTRYQISFIDAFMQCGKKSDSLLRAGYKGNGKKSSLDSQASKMYANPKVRAEINRRRSLLAEKNIISAEQIIQRLTKMFNGELNTQFVTKQGEIVEVPINFKSQIEAAKVLVSILGLEADKKIDVKHEIKITDQLSESLEAATRTFLAKRLETKQLETEYQEIIE
jgi:phage terminase small subunit